MIAGNIDMTVVELEDFPTYKASEATGNYTIYQNPQPNWTVCSIELNQTYEDEQYRQLFSEIDFRHALSIAANRDEMNEILFNGLAEPSQAAASEGNSQYIEGAPEKWTEYDPDAANELLDGISMISTTRNADGYRTFVDGEHAGEAVTIVLETTADNNSSEACALLAQYFKEIGIQLVDSSNTDRPTRQQQVGDECSDNRNNCHQKQPAARQIHVLIHQRVVHHAAHGGQIQNDGDNGCAGEDIHQGPADGGNNGIQRRAHAVLHAHCLGLHSFGPGREHIVPAELVQHLSAHLAHQTAGIHQADNQRRDDQMLCQIQRLCHAPRGVFHPR